MRLRPISLIVVALVIYGSLYPWHFHAAATPGNPVLILFRSWPAEITRFVLRDVLVNLLMYLPVGAIAALIIAERHSRSKAIVLAVLFSFLLSGTMEITQLFDDARTCSALDLLCNTVSGLMGAVTALTYERWLRRIIDRARTTGDGAAGALVLVCIWFGYEVFPLFPSLSRTQLFEKVNGLIVGLAISPVESLTVLAEWLVAARLLECVWGLNTARRVIALLMLVLPAKLFLLGRTLNQSEIVGAGAALIVFECLDVGENSRTLALAGLLLGVVFLRGMAPYHWSSEANPFSWIPFSGFLESDHDFGVLSFLRKCFWYGSSIWLLVKAGRKWITSALMVATILAVIEVIQIHLPGRVAEVTDPVLAFILAGVLALADWPYVRKPVPRTP